MSHVDVARKLLAEAHALWWAPWTNDLSADLLRHVAAMEKARAAFALVRIGCEGSQGDGE